MELEEFTELCKKYDILCFCETKIDDVDNDDVKELFKKLGFHVFTKNRQKFTNWRSGGVVLAVSDVWVDKCEEIKVPSNICVCVKLKKEILGYEKDIVVIAAYVPPYKLN